MVNPFPVYQCTHPECRLRFPAQSGHGNPEKCPKCGNPARLVESPGMDLRIRPHQPLQKTPIVEGFLDNIRSTFNVGAMFRTSDAAGLRKLHLAGITPLPVHPRVAKTALGAEQSLPWQHHPDGAEAVALLRSNGMQVWVLEGGETSESIYHLSDLDLTIPILLVVGNEVTGTDPAILRSSDRRIKIPMLGYKESLNVAIAFAVAVYTIRFTLGNS